MQAHVLYRRTQMLVPPTHRPSSTNQNFDHTSCRARSVCDGQIFKKDQRIIYYLGEVIDTDTLETRYTTYTAPYGIMVANDKYIDSALE